MIALLALLLAQLAGTPGQIQTPNAGRWTSQQGTFLQNGTGAGLRTLESKMRDWISVKDFKGTDGINCLGDGLHDDTSCIQAAITYCQTLVGAGSVNLGGCTVYLPEGIYAVSSINLSSATSVFYRQLRLKGAGRWATAIVANSSGKILIDMLGQNLADISDLSIDSTTFQSQAAIFVGRSTTSTQANDNHFTDLHITGNYSKASAVCLGCESSSWTRVRFENSNSSTASWTVVPATNPSHVTFYGGDDNAQIGITSTNGTLSTNGSTDNVMTDCQFYAPFDNASLTYFHNTSAYRFLGGSWIAGTQSNVRLVTLQSNTGIYNGSMDFVGPHFEWFGTGSAFWLDANNTTTQFKGLHFFNGFFNANGGTFIDYDRKTQANQPDLIDATVNSVKGNQGSSGFQVYLFGLETSNIHWQPFDDQTGTVAVFGFINDSVIKTWNLFPPGPQSSTNRFHYLEQYASSIPVTGTYSAGHIIWNTAPATGGTPLGWIVTAAGTAGSLNGNATTITSTSGTNTGTVSTATGLVVGQHVVCGANGVHTVTAISGTSIWLSTNWSANCTAVGLFYAGPTIVPLQTGSNAGSITLSSGTPSTGTATVASGSKCVCTNATTQANAIKCAVSSTTLTATGPNTVTDSVTYLCF